MPFKYVTERVSIMAKFCIHCGRPLKDGEVCQCQASADASQNAAGTAEQQTSADTNGGYRQAAPNDRRQYSQSAQGAAQQGAYQPAPGPYVPKTPKAPNGFSIYMSQLWECIKAYFNDAPGTIGVASSHKDVKTGLTFACVGFIMFGLSAMSILSSSMRSIKSSLSLLSGPLASSKGLGSVMLLSAIPYIKIPYGSFFLLLLILSAIAFFAMCGIGMIMSSMSNKGASFGAVVASLGVATLPVSLLAAAAALFGLILAPFGIFLIAAAVCTWIICSFTAIKIVSGVSDRKFVIYFGLIAAVVLAILLAIFSSSVRSMVMHSMSRFLGSLNSLFN